MCDVNVTGWRCASGVRGWRCVAGVQAWVCVCVWGVMVEVCSRCVGVSPHSVYNESILLVTY